MRRWREQGLIEAIANAQLAALLYVGYLAFLVTRVATFEATTGQFVPAQSDLNYVVKYHGMVSV